MYREILNLLAFLSPKSTERYTGEHRLHAQSMIQRNIRRILTFNLQYEDSREDFFCGRLLYSIRLFTYTINTPRNQVQLLIGFFFHIEYSLCTKLMDIVTERKDMYINELPSIYYYFYVDYIVVLGLYKR